MIRLTINVSLILLLLSVSFRPVISALDGPNLALNVTESPAFKKSNLRIRNDMASRSVRQLVSLVRLSIENVSTFLSHYGSIFWFYFLDSNTRIKGLMLINLAQLKLEPLQQGRIG